MSRIAHRTRVTDLNKLSDLRLSYEQLVDAFELVIGPRYNMAADTVTRHSRGRNASRTALICAQADGATTTYTYRELEGLANRFAAFLKRHGIGRGDVVTCYSDQGLETALTHLACYKLGAVVAPLSSLYGRDTLRHALRDCGARVIVTRRDLWSRVQGIRSELGHLDTVIIGGGAAANEYAFEAAVDGPSAPRVNVDTVSVEPALLLYTSGSTGLPKGVLHAHRVLLGYLSSMSLFYQLDLDEPARVLWTPSDWSWVAGIFNVMLTGWYYGQTVLASQNRFDPEWAFDFMERHGVTHTFLTPTALKRLAGVSNARRRWPRLALRAIGTGGEPLPTSILQWFQSELGVPINEFYGLTEVNHLIGNCQRLYPVKPGSMGRAYPGHVLAILGADDSVLSNGSLGEIAARFDDPTMFMGYWNRPDQRKSRLSGEWFRTGDMAICDADGYYWFHGRNDDLIKSAGYRIGPSEVEDVLLGHPAVSEAAVIGAPDAERGQIVEAFVRLAEPESDRLALAHELQDLVKTRLAYHKYPRSIVFVDELPLTSTGKINRAALRKVHS